MVRLTTRQSLGSWIDIYTAEGFEATFRTLPRPIALLFCAHFAQSEICNGGFTQLFSNSSGTLAPEAAMGLAAIGQTEVGDLMVQSIDVLSTSNIRDRISRKRALARLNPLFAERHHNVEQFGLIEERFYDLLRSEARGFEVADGYAAKFGGSEATAIPAPDG